MKGRLVALAVLAGAAVPAAAYLLPARGVLKKMAGHRDNLGLHTLMVRGAYTFRGDDAKTAAEKLGGTLVGDETTVAAELAYKLPGKCAITVPAASGVAADAAVVSLVDGKLKAVGPELKVLRIQAALACPLLYQKTTQAGDAQDFLAQVMEAQGVALDKVVLARLAGNIAYVIGGPPRNLAVPQLWVDKDSFEPLRVVAKAEGAIHEVRLHDWTSPASGEWHPRVIEVRSGENLLGRFVAEKVDNRAKIADAIF